jgi:hypothetical protein
MESRKLLAAVGMTAAVGLPVTSTIAAADQTAVDTTVLQRALQGNLAVATDLGRVAHHRLVADDTRLARSIARLRQHHLSTRTRKRIAHLSNNQLVRENKRLGRQLRRLRATGGAPNVAIPTGLAAIAACESGGNPRAIGGGGLYRGKYQMTYAAWASVGGKGDPAAAPEAEQDRRAAMLLAQSGSGQWPVCG